VGPHNPCQTLRNIAAKYGVTHAVVETGNPFTICHDLPTPFQDANYTLYALTSKP